jgi:tellurite resistance protein
MWGIMPLENTPENTPPQEDVGAETGYRFRYQDDWAATLACALLDDPKEFVELYCEHHEDILLKRGDGKFQGIQIKTRALHLAQWTAEDESVFKSLCRFVELDYQFPGHFSRFDFATNHFFFQDSKSRKNLPHVLDLCAGVDTAASAPGAVKPHLKKIAEQTRRTKDEVLATLKKTTCTAELPKLIDSRKVLRESIVRSYAAAQDAVPAKIHKAAELLATAIRNASSMAHRDTLPAYLCHASQPAEQEDAARIEAKRFSPARVTQILAEALTNFTLLVPAAADSEMTQEELADRLARKLNAGGLSEVSINLARDLRAAALHRFIEWRERFGEDEALRRYEHLKTLVLKDCAEAHETAKNNSELFGRRMLEILRTHLASRSAGGASDMFDCREEHLEGCAYELTGACKVWWSHPFQINPE